MKICNLLFFLVFPGFLSASSITVSGSVAGVWNVDTVLVADDIQVDNGQTLLIDPGVKVIFQGHFTFRIEGCIIAPGLPGNEILFTVADTTGFSNLQTDEGGWNGLWFSQPAPANDSSLFEHCMFEFGKAVGSDTTFWYGGAACIREFNKLRFSHCSFVNNRAYKNGGAIYAKKSNILIEACFFENNFCGLGQLFGYGGGVCLEYSAATVRWNHFTDNRSTGVGGGLSYEHSDPSVVSNVFQNNFSAIGGGFVGLRSNGQQTVANNLVAGNGALFFGGGIALIETTMLFAGNTVVNNSTGGGGGIYCNESSFPVFKNCILWGNSANAGGPQVYVWDTYSAPGFYFCAVQGGVEEFGGTGGAGGGYTGVYEDCLETDPLFVNQGEYPFSLGENSPCIDAGTPDTAGLMLPGFDLAGNGRIINGIIDMGAYENQLVSDLSASKTGPCRVVLFPNPSRGKVSILIHPKEQKHSRIKVLDPTGRLVMEPVISYPFEEPIELRIGGLKPGVYLVLIESDSGIEAVKLMVN